MGVGPSERFREGSGFADWMDHGTSFILGPLPTLIYSFVKFLHERQDEGLLGCLLREIFLSVWVEKQGPQRLPVAGLGPGPRRCSGSQGSEY